MLKQNVRTHLSWIEYFKDPLILSTSSGFQHRSIPDLLWSDGPMYVPCWVTEELRRIGPHASSSSSATAAAHGASHRILLQKSQAEDNDGAIDYEKCSHHDLVDLLKSCATKGDLDMGTKLHAYLLKKRLLEKTPHLVCALINMYAKCGMFAKAHGVLEDSCFQNVFCWNALIGGYAHHGQAETAIHWYEQMQSEAMFPDAVTLTCILKACGGIGAISKGKQIHEIIVSRKLLKEDTVLGNGLVDMYVKCGALSEANEVLEELPIRDVVSWNSVIGGYCQYAQGNTAFECFDMMQNEGLLPDAITFICILKGVRDTEKGRQMHKEIMRRGLLETDPHRVTQSNALIDMYAKCGALADAQKVLEKLPIRDVVSWNALIAGYAQQGRCREALVCYGRMQSEGLSPDSITFICILKACGSIGAVVEGRGIHKEIVSRKFMEKDTAVGASVVEMYAKCGFLTKAQEVLEELCVQDMDSWCAVIAGYVQHEQAHEALGCFERMQSHGLSPNEGILVHILKVCGSNGAIERGQSVHEEIARRGLSEKNVMLGTALLDMYVKCGALGKAHQVHRELPNRDVVSWNALISGYSQQGRCDEALNCLDMMQAEGFPPSSVTFICMLKVCGSARAMEVGKRMHERISRSGLLKQDIALGNALVDMYAKCGELTKAQDVLLQELPVRDVVAWNTLIGAYTQQGQCAQALDCFEHMQAEGILPDEVTFLCILKACSVEKGMQIHDQILYKGLLEKDLRLGNALMDMYLRCGMPSKALEVLDALPLRDTASFNTLISGLSQQGKSHEAMDFYERMRNEGLRPDIVTFLCMLKICGSTRAIAKGKLIHEEIKSDRHLLEEDIALGNALVDMYAKCGMLAKAKEVLEGLPDRDIVSWSIVLAAYVQSGRGVEALALFEQMESEGFSSDAVTFIHMLEACGSAGTLGKGKQIHVRIASKGLLARDGVLGTALVSMYARCGALEKAKQVLQELNLLCDVVSWNALIAACAQLGRCEEALKCYEEMQSNGWSPNAATFVSMLKACGGAGAVDKGERIRGEIMDRGLYGCGGALGNALIDMYAQCGMLGKAQQMLEEEAPIIAGDVASWNALIVEHARRERYNEALDCYEQMCSGERRRRRRTSLCPDVATYVGILKACGNAGAIDKGEAVRDEIRKRGLLGGSLVLGNALIDMYCKCGAMAMAEELLEQLHVRDAASWNAVISGYAERSRGREALSRFEEMRIEGLYPDEATFLCALSACSHSGLVNEAWILFCSMNRGDGIVPKLEHHSCMLVLLGYAGHFAKAMSLIEELGSSDHPILWLGILGACRKWGNVKLARLAFGEILKLDGACAEAYVIMADIYAVAGMPESAEKLLSCGSE